MPKKDYNQLALEMHRQGPGKIEVTSKVQVKDRDALSTAYTPGVAEPCRKIHDNEEDVYTYTSKGNMIAVVTDGTAVLGLGDIGPKAALPVMEGKCILFKNFANVDAFPICLDTKDPDEIVETVRRIAPGFGGINLEDISAPRCFEVEEKLKKILDIPVFHDDQHGTAIVVGASMINALKIVKKKIEEITVVISGAGSAGIAICKLLQALGVGDVILVDRQGALAPDTPGMNPAQEVMAQRTNKNQKRGSLKEVLKGADLFVGVSAPNLLQAEDIRTMAKDPIVFSLANPVPEIMPEESQKGGARIIASGRSDYPNQINNVLVFPGVFKGALEARATDITEEMKMAAVYALAGVITDEELREDYIIPGAFDPRVAERIAEAVADCARKTGVARK